VNTNAKKFHEGQGAAEERHGKRNLGWEDPITA
jgi:hypothetical protein